MKTQHLITLLVAACFTTAAFGEWHLVPGDPDAPDAEFHPLTPGDLRELPRRGRLLYHLVECYRRCTDPDAFTKERAAAAECRRLVLERIESHPDEINDVLLDHGGTDSVLYHAVRSNDVELVRLLLDKGAIPFLHEQDGWDTLGPSKGDLLLRMRGTKPEIIDMLRKERRRYNVLEIMIQAKKNGVDLKSTWPKRPAKKK